MRKILMIGSLIFLFFMSACTTSQPSPLVTKEVFFDSIGEMNKGLANDPRIKELFTTKDPAIEQLVFTGDQVYTAAWIKDIGYTGLLIIFKQDVENGVVPIYFDSPGERIESIKLLTVKEIPFIEVTSSGVSGSFSNKKTELLSIEDGKISKAWDEVISSIESHIDIETGLEERTYHYKPYLITKEYAEPNSSKETPVIISQEITTKVVVKNEKVISKSSETNEKRYAWDEKINRFEK